MIPYLHRLSAGLIASCLFLSSPVIGGPQELNKAISLYYQGYPAQAIEFLKPLANAGDVESQYLLGNILYSLSKAGVIDSDDEAIAWYRMAAEQESAGASYALAVIFDNRWRRTGNRQHAADAIVYYRRAVDLGHLQATSPLARLRTQSGLSEKAAIAQSGLGGAPTVPRPESAAAAPSKPASGSASGDEPVVVGEGGNGSEGETSVETVARSESSDPTGVAPAAPDGSGSPGVTVAQIATRCEQYTEVGFDLYASTIRGARLSGQASVAAVESDAANPGTYLVNFTDRRQAAAVTFELGQVPAAVVANYPQGKPAALSGIVVDSKTSSTGCSISLRYQPEKG